MDQLNRNYPHELTQAKMQSIPADLMENFRKFKDYATNKPIGMRKEAEERRTAASELFKLLTANPLYTQLALKNMSNPNLSSESREEAKKKFAEFSTAIQTTLEETAEMRKASPKEKLTGLLTNLKESLDDAVKYLDDPAFSRSISHQPKR